MRQSYLYFRLLLWEQRQLYPSDTRDCGNGSYCPKDKKCARDGGHCLAEDVVDCVAYQCASGSKCGSNRTCLPDDAVDCGSGNSCASAKFAVGEAVAPP